MTWKTDAPFDLDVDGTRLEARAWGPPPDAAPTIVLLHEGLGSANMWRALPEALTAATGAGVLAYSRAGYGASAPNPPPWPLDYLEAEARTALPGVLNAAGIETALLVGHSDGGSIVAAYLGQQGDPRVRAAVLIAPHFFTEPGGLAAIRAARQAFARDIRPRLARHHRDVDALFEGWSGAWGDPDFKVGQIEPLLPNIQVPVLAIQGRQDQYGTLAQIQALTRHLPNAPEIAILDDCGHSPHAEKPGDTARLIADFARKMLF
ncbi:MAG TPA: alpha/beta hydrolase [Aliiroseovarius sp.]|nr:alpha/beta hydrolase [Aliiroseovarius sp.]